MEKCLHAIDWFNDRAGVGFAYLLPPLVLVVVLGVISRYIFKAPYKWTFEMTDFLWGGFCMLGGAYCILYDDHVKIDVLWGRFSKRGKAIADLVTFIFFAAFAWVLFWLGTEATIMALHRPWETTITNWAPIIWPVNITIPIGGFLMLLQGVAKFIRDFRIATKRAGGEA